MDKVCFYLNLTRKHLVKSRDDLCCEDIFLSSYKITKEVEANASYKDDADGADKSSDESDDGDDFTVEEEELITGMFNQQTCFNSPDCIARNSAKWHDKYSRHHAPVFGYIACGVTSKITGSGGADCGWADKKMIKTSKPSNIRQAQIKRAELEKSDCLSKGACWGEEDEQFELGLLKWGVDVEELKKQVGPRRLFKCWIKDWEIVMDNLAVMRTRLLKKYGGMVFDDIDVDPVVRILRVSSTKLNWIRREGWHAMAEPPDYVGDGDDDDKLEPLATTEEVLIELIKNTTQPEDLKVRMVKGGDNKVEVEGDEEGED
eukprot:CCRYP_015153-RA/>CCRYP_015153-RA protein AED:0.20 eAED:0.16 QI:0/0/0/1/1/1/3/0/316